MTQANISMSQRQRLRNDLRIRRNILSPAEQRIAAQKLFCRLSRNYFFRRAKKILFYWPSDGEISLLPLLKHALRNGKQCYLPAIDVFSKKIICRHHQRGSPLRANIFGIPEPQKTAKLIRPHQLDLALLPLVGFDNHGNRLGMGGGYYDRTFAKLRDRRPLLIGLAHSVQKVSKLDRAVWDIPMHGIFTEKNFYWI